MNLKEDATMNAFQRIAGYVKEKEELLALVEIFNNRQKYERKGATLPKGIIFYGPAGTGKTLFADVLSQECKMKKTIIEIADSTGANDICKKIRKAFAQASKSKTPTMIFFDELDKVLPNAREEYYTDRSKTILAQLLTLIDGMEKNNVVFVATCNDYFALPESITRAGRFDKKICLDIPDFSSRIAILKMYMDASSAKFELEASAIAKLIAGFSPAEIRTLVNECIFLSDENNYITENIIRQKINEIKEEDIPTERSEQSCMIDAVRNIGAFIVARTYCNSDYVLTFEENKVSNFFLDSIIDGAEYDDDYDDDDDYYDDEEEDDDYPYHRPSSDYDETPFMADDLMENLYSTCSRNDIIASITALLGGYVAEEVVLNKIYDNLKESMDSIDTLLFKMSACGMLGIDLYFNLYSEYRYSDKMHERLEEAFLKIKAECYANAREQIVKNETLIKKLVPILTSRKSIEKSECEGILEELGGIVS